LKDSARPARDVGVVGAYAVVAPAGVKAAGVRLEKQLHARAAGLQRRQRVQRRVICHARPAAVALLLKVPGRVAEVARHGARHRDGVALALPVREGVPDSEPVAEGLAEGVPLVDAEPDALAVPLGVADGEPAGEAPAGLLGDGEPDSEDVAEPEPLAVPLPVPLTDAVSLGDGVELQVADGNGDTEADTDSDWLPL
jgi:hypothetical protein